MMKSISTDELDELSELLEEKQNEAIFYEYIKLNYALDYNMSKFNTEKTKLVFLHKVKEEEKKFTLLHFVKYGAVAAIALLVMLPLVWKKSSIEETPIISQPILPGSDKAILTLDDGKHVTLEKGKKYAEKYLNSDGESLVYDTVALQEKEKIAFNYLTIPRGGQFFIKLSDGTKVWLNSESKLKYPVNFIKGKTRQVELLYGEAYFDVTHSTEFGGSQFHVKTQVQNIEVVGTEFNVKAYENEELIYTTLVEGEVIVDNGITNEVLKPGKQAAVNAKTDAITIKTIDVTYETAWKRGFFMFDKETLEDMMKTLSRWYDIEVVFEDQEKRDIIFSGLLNRSNEINELLINLEKTDEVKFEINDKKITIQ